MDRLDGRVAVVTGAASGIGRALCMQLASEGCRVVLADVEATPLAEAEEALQRTGVRTLSVVTDVSDAASVDELARKTLDAFGAVHVLCNNAGVSWRSELINTSLNDWSWVLGVNLWGVINGLHSFLPVLLEQDEAHVITTASITGLVPGAYSAVYASSKAAVIAISEVLYKEMTLAKTNVGVSVACPANVSTNIGTSKRNRPAEFAPGTSTEPRELFARLMVDNEYVRESMNSAMTPDEFAEMMLESIKDRRFWVLPHSQIDPHIIARADDMVADRPPRPGPVG
jgi:NAD(P)-dependent dehydrogenase (short-subunit alcohol dehydrogenase family)